MKRTACLRLLVALAVSAAWPALATINIPSDGSDGALIISGNTVIDLSQAVTGNWDATNNANAGNGIYDSNKWAVVFKYSSVTVQSNATVTFKNHASRAPVVWLVQGDTTINGTVSLDGQTGATPPLLAEPGPGGFRGGCGNYAANVGLAAGFGPGGGIQCNSASYGGVGNASSPTYGNPYLLPLIGGSGAGGGGASGGAGGGALLVASGGTVTISGAVRANGGGPGGTSGSGGGIRLVCETLDGKGTIRATGGGSDGGLGRIALERVSYPGALTINPDPNVVALASGDSPLIWLPTNGPTVRIASIGARPVAADPRATFDAVGADVTLPLVTSTVVMVETTNVEQGATVIVRSTPRSNNGNPYNGRHCTTNATVSQIVSTNPLVLRWSAIMPVSPGYSAYQVRVVRQ